MKTVLILGSRGMAGHIITLYLEETKKYKVYSISYKKKLKPDSKLIDVLDLSKVKELLKEIKPNVIINSIGILNDKSDNDLAYTTYINTFFPLWLEKFFSKTKTKIIHLSTDCVFSGKKGNYTENDEKDDATIYGLSKNLGEIKNNKDLTIRTSIIGPELKDGSGLFHWFMKQKGNIKGFKNVYWTGLTTLELAHFIDYALANDLFQIYNVVPPKKISKYDLLLLLKEVFKKDDINIISSEEPKNDRSLITKRNLNYKFKSYLEQLKELKTWMEKHPNLYEFYFPKKVKERIIIIWSKFKTKDMNAQERKEWLKHRLKILMNYTVSSFKNQTNQNFFYLLNYDNASKDILLKELNNYPPLPKNIIFTNNYHREIKKIIINYRYLFLVRIDSDDMYDKNFIHKLHLIKPKKETKALISQKGYIYDIFNNILAHWSYISPPFYTLIYKTWDFYNGLRHQIKGHKSVINLPHELIEGDNFIVIIHNKNTVSRFHSSFNKGIITNEVEKQKIINHFNLKKGNELNE